MAWKTVKGCFCMSLRTAGWFLAWLGIVLSVLSYVFLLYLVIEGYYYRTKFSMYFVLLMQGLSFLFGLLINALVMRGILKNKAHYLLPWLVLAGIGVIFFSYVSMKFCIKGLILNNSTQPFFAAAVVFLFLLLPLGLNYWALIVMYSLYEEIRLNTRKPLNAELAEGGKVQLFT